MVRALHVLAFVGLVATVYSFCSTDAECSDWASTTCGHGEHAECQMVHGAGGGNGEMQCACVHNGKRAVQCTSNPDCHAVTCPHGQHASCVSHGVGGQISESFCECV